MRKILCTVLLAALACTLLLFAGCGATKILHCDKCGAEISVSQSSNVEEDWLLFCKACSDEMGPMVEER